MAFSLSRGPALALIDSRGVVVRLTDTFRAGFAPEGSPHLSIWDFLPDPDQRSRLGKVLEGRLLRADLALPSPTGAVAAEAEAVLDAAVMRHALLTVAAAEPDADPRSGADVLLDDASVMDSPAIVWLKDLSGRYLRVNRRYTERLGINEIDILGTTDAELSPAHIVAEPRSVGHRDGGEPAQLEYTVDAVGAREALTVLRFPIHGLNGAAVAVCGVAAPVADAATARSEADRLLRLERWAGLSAAAIRAELIQEWQLAELADIESAAEAPPPAVRARPAEPGAATPELAELRDELAAARAAAAELEARLASAAAARVELEAGLASEAAARTELETRLADETARGAELREAAAAAARRADQLVSGAANEHTRIAELEAAVAAQRRRAEGAEREVGLVRGRADVAEREVAEARRRAEAAEREVADARGRAEAAEREAADARGRAGAAEREVADARGRAEAAERELAAARARVDELERASAESSTAVERMEAERAARAELEQRAREAERRAEEAERNLAAERVDATRARDELAARAERAETAVAQARAAAERATGLAQRAEAAAELTRGRAEGLETTLASAREGEADNRLALDRARVEIANLEAALERARAQTESRVGAGAPAPTAAVVEPPRAGRSAPGPSWNADAQRSLTSSLAQTAEWRTGLKDSLRIIGTQAGWDVAIAWCPDERGHALRCTAMWMSAPEQLALFETATWQRRQSPTASLAGRSGAGDHASWFGDLTAVNDAQLAAAAGEGMRGALLVPMRHGDETVGVLELLTRRADAPAPEVTTALEAVGLQLAHFEHLLRRGAEPRWRLGRL